MKIVFILGAGASADYDFPVGEGLFNEMTKIKGFLHLGSTIPEALFPKLSRGNHESAHERYIYHLLEGDKQKDLQVLSGFFDAVKSSLHQSMDFFIDEFPEYEKWGKVAITHYLLRKELIFWQNIHKYRDKGWYPYLFREDIISPSSLKKHRISFVTFNYERSLELYLYHYYGYTYSKSRKGKSIFDCLSEIDFVHIHGSFGPLGTIQYQQDGLAEPTSPSAAQTILNASKGIKTIQEGKSDKEFKQAQALISNADKVYVLGFGFNSENTDNLFNCDFPEDTFGTAKDHSEKEREKFNAIAHDKLTPGNQEGRGVTLYPNPVRLYDCSISELFQLHHPILEVGDGDFSHYQFNKPQGH